MLADVDRDAFLEDEALHLAVTYLLQIIGEAASRLSPEFRGEHVDVPWRKVVGQRNIIAHEYGNVDFRLIWETAQRDLKVLVALIDRVLANPER